LPDKMNFAEIILILAEIYFAIGVIFAGYFVAFQIGKYDETAKDSSVFFRFIIFFGAAALWIALVFQILQNKEKVEVTAHRI
jgi:Kef-type K+ transport system membrane component KefB